MRRLREASWTLMLWVGLWVLVRPVQAQPVPPPSVHVASTSYAHLTHAVHRLTQAGHHAASTPAVCVDFPPPTGERWTYRLVGTTLTFSTFTEQVSGLIGGQVVYRIGATDSPPGLGLYIGCNDTLGEVDVATDSWNAFEPDNPQFYGRDFWEPPLFYCQPGNPAGTVCEWTGTFGGEQERNVMEVLAYESIVVPLGAFDNVMKAQITTFDSDGEVIPEPGIFWLDPSVGVLRAEGADTGEAIELIAYTPVPTGIVHEPPEWPDAPVLGANYPNPFASETFIEYRLAGPSTVALSVYGLTGRRVATLVAGRQGAGRHRVVWDGRDEQGRRVASGVYLYTLEVDGGSTTQTMILIE